MTYQPVFVRIEDSAGASRQTKSCGCHKITNASGWVNTHFGEIMSFSIKSDGQLPKDDETHIIEKIAYWKNKGNIRKVEYWKTRFDYAKAHNRQIEDLENAVLHMDVNFKDKFVIYLNGSLINEDTVALSEYILKQDWYALIKYIQLKYNVNMLDDMVARNV